LKNIGTGNLYLMFRVPAKPSYQGETLQNAHERLATSYGRDLVTQRSVSRKLLRHNGHTFEPSSAIIDETPPG
jgi:hypothetical protein